MDKIPPLPDEIVNIIIQLNTQSDVVQWKMGDVLVDVVDEIGVFYASILGSERVAHAWIVKHLAARTGLARSTINDRENVARFFPPEERDKLEPLTYHQCRALKAAGDNWKVYLEWVHEYAADHGGALPSVEAIRREIAGHGEIDEPWMRRIDQAREKLIAATFDHPPQEIGDVLYDCIKQLEFAKKKVIKKASIVRRVQSKTG